MGCQARSRHGPPPTLLHTRRPARLHQNESHNKRQRLRLTLLLLFPLAGFEATGSASLRVAEEASSVSARRAQVRAQAVSVWVFILVNELG